MSIMRRTPHPPTGPREPERVTSATTGAVSAPAVEPLLRRARFTDLTPAELYALLRLRVDVFVVEQRCPYPELDGRDTEPGTTHLWLEVDGAPVAVLRVLDDGEAHSIGRVATPLSMAALATAGAIWMMRRGSKGRGMM